MFASTHPTVIALLLGATFGIIGPHSPALAPGLSGIAAFATATNDTTNDTSNDARGDTTCAPCTDFYNYANRAWLDSASIPPSKSSWGAYDINAARMQAQLHFILDSAAAAPEKKRQSSVIGAFYAPCMDTASTEKARAAPLASTFAEVDSIHSPSAIMREIGSLQRRGVNAAFEFSSEVNRSGGQRYVATLASSSLGLPGRRYYMAHDSSATATRAAYVAYITRMFEFAGTAPASAREDAERVLAIETSLAQAAAAAPSGSDDDLVAMFHVSTRSALAALTPGLEWNAFYRGRGVSAPSGVIVSEPIYTTGVARLIETRPAADWRAYFRWRVLSDASPWLSSDFRNERFRFLQRFSGATTQPPRWQNCVDEANADLTELLGRAYAKRAFSESSKVRIETMVNQIRAVLVARLHTVPWLTEPTRRQALEKAAAFRVKIGYPDKWHDFTKLGFDRESFIAARTAARRFEADRMIARIGRSPDRAQWDFHSFYHFVPQSPTDWANWDEIIFPAAALQPPYFDPKADDATNFGAIGVIIAHEMTHLFTADGGSIDAHGNVRQWWTPEDSARFAVLTKRTVDQYNHFTVIDSATHVNGEQTLGENLADIGGIQLAYAALERSQNEKRLADVGGRTPEQRFFLAYAHVRAEKMKPEYARVQLANDGHSPGAARTNVPLSNFAPFGAAFGCKTGSAMVRELSVNIWQ